MERHYMFINIATYMMMIYLVQAQDPTGFINVDCGLPPHESPYNAPRTGLAYTSDAGFINSGKTGRIAKEFEEDYSKPLLTLRYFPEGIRNCYHLNVTRNTNYMIKATFLYGNYDGYANDDPNFDLYLGPNFCLTVNSNDTREEIIHVTKSNSLQVCLVRTGATIPYINVLELRPLPKTGYVTNSGGSLKMNFRIYLSNSNVTIRYPNDIYDRSWNSYFEKSWAEVTTTLNIAVNNSNELPLPQGVMATGATPLNVKETLNMTWDVEPPTAKSYTYLYFAELQTLRANETREFDMSLNGRYLYGPYSPKPFQAEISKINTEPNQCDGGECLLQLVKTLHSTLPPLLNAVEVFVELDLPQMETNDDDVAGIKSIQDTYGLSRISWQGDPCVPEKFLWDGLRCDNSKDSVPPIITSLDLSSSKLSGNITQAIENLTHLQKLNLSNNNLTGEIPEFLAYIKSLLVIDLSGNNFTGSVPPSLLQKKGMKLNVDNNPNLLCTADSCVNKGDKGHKKKSIVVPLVASIASLAVLVVAIVIFLGLIRKKASNVEGQRASDMQSSQSRSSQPAIMMKNRRFTYSEVVTMTNNFQRALGKGGFGIVYHGFVNGTEQVAVKILSHSSSQGYKQFKAEVELLLRVHHKNLVSLVGYCDEGENMALIYEYMANRDLKEHLSGTSNRFILNWGTRLKIVIEAAQGLEYLHNGCRPPMVHRDVKTTNILLNEHFEAKLADFGLSRPFPTEGEPHESSLVAGTLGYLDPEYYRTNWLTEKSDVYSFGIVMLEIITNRPVMDQSREKPHIAEWVGLMLIKGDITSIMDPSLNGLYDSGSVWKALELAMSCLNPASTSRPTMPEVVIRLNECLANENSRGGASRDMDSKSSKEVSLTLGTEVKPAAR